MDSGPFGLTDVADNDPLNVRSSPNADSPKNIVGKLVAGTRDVYVTGEAVKNGIEEWIPIRSGALKGWVRSKHVERDDVGGLPETSNPEEILEFDQAPDYRQITEANPAFTPPPETFEFQISPLPTRPVDPALLGKWSYTSDDKFMPLELVFSRKDQTHYEVTLSNDTALWPKKTLAWHSDFLDESFLTILIPNASDPGYAIFAWTFSNGGKTLNLTALSRSKVEQFSEEMRLRNWEPPTEVGLSKALWPGPLKDATQFRAIVRQLLRRKTWEGPVGHPYDRGAVESKNDTSLRNYLDGLRQINQTYFMTAAYMSEMEGFQTGWKYMRLSEIENGPWAPAVPASFRDCVRSAIGADYYIAFTQAASAASGIANLQFLYNWPQHLGAALGRKEDERDEALDITSGLWRQQTTIQRWEAYRSWRRSSRHAEEWVSALEQIPRSSDIDPQLLERPNLTLPSHLWVTGGNLIDVFPFQNNAGVGPQGRGHPWPDYNKVRNLGSLRKGPIKIIIGPWNQMLLTGITLDTESDLPVYTQAACSSGHFGYQRAEANFGFNSGKNPSGWAWGGGVDPVTHGTTIGPNKRLYLGIAHVPLGPYGTAGPAIGSITVYVQGQNPASPASVFKIGSSGRVTAF